jgi:hypothetical protein
LFPAVSTERGKQTWNQRFSKRMKKLGFNGVEGSMACAITTKTLSLGALFFMV